MIVVGKVWVQEGRREGGGGGGGGPRHRQDQEGAELLPWVAVQVGALQLLAKTGAASQLVWIQNTLVLDLN